mgnify:CR=1 FL=1
MSKVKKKLSKLMMMIIIEMSDIDIFFHRRLRHQLLLISPTLSLFKYYHYYFV